MASVVDVCNRALDKLGHTPITSLGDGTAASSLCDRTWPIVRDRALRAYPWNFAIKRVTTAPDTTAPVWGFNYTHTLPSDCLYLIEIKDTRPDEYVIEGGKIFTNESVLYLRYVRRIEDPNLFDALFTDAVASLMAYEMAEKLTQSNQKRELAYREYTEQMTQAKRTDAMENPVTEYREDSWIEARY